MCALTPPAGMLKGARQLHALLLLVERKANVFSGRRLAFDVGRKSEPEIWIFSYLPGFCLVSSLVGSVLCGDHSCSTSSPVGNLVDGLPPVVDLGKQAVR